MAGNMDEKSDNHPLQWEELVHDFWPSFENSCSRLCNGLDTNGDPYLKSQSAKALIMVKRTPDGWI